MNETESLKKEVDELKKQVEILQKKEKKVPLNFCIWCGEETERPTLLGICSECWS